MRTIFDISILVILLIIAYTSIAGLMKLGEIEKKIQAGAQRIGDMEAQEEVIAARKEISASELSSALRAKLSDQQVRELNLKFQ